MTSVAADGKADIIEFSDSRYGFICKDLWGIEHYRNLKDILDKEGVYLVKPELAESLYTRFSWIKPQGIDVRSPWNLYGFSCGDGWFQLLWDMFAEIENEYRNNGNEINLIIGQIKEKFGALRVYIHNALPVVYEIVERYQKISAEFCEGCGISSHIQKRGSYFTTRCDTCYEIRIKMVSEKIRDDNFLDT